MLGKPLLSALRVSREEEFWSAAEIGCVSGEGGGGGGGGGNVGVVDGVLSRFHAV